jgi:hypothetical protein
LTDFSDRFVSKKTKRKQRAKEINDESASVEHVNNNTTNDSHESKTGKGERSCGEPKKVSKKLYKRKKIDNDIDSVKPVPPTQASNGSHITNKGRKREPAKRIFLLSLSN